MHDVVQWNPARIAEDDDQQSALGGGVSFSETTCASAGS